MREGLLALSVLFKTGYALTCGDGFTLAGSTSTNRLVRSWVAGYQEEYCGGQSIGIVVEDSTSSTGAARVCGVRRDASPVDVATMTRPMNRLEAITEDDWRFQCQRSTRSTIQIEVGIEGVALASATQGVAADCIQKLGGLSIDQLRWIYSDMTESQLIDEEDGWELQTTVPYSDGNDTTRLWSELHSDCEPVEIGILGMAPDTPSYNYFEAAVMEARNEDIDATRYNSNQTWSVEDLVLSLQEHPEAIGFFGIRFVLSEQEKSAIETISTLSLRRHNSGDFVDPSFTFFDDTSYPLATRLYLNLNRDETTLENSVRPFVEYAYSPQGIELLLEAGFWPIPEWERVVMKTRAQTETGIPLEDIVCGPSGGEVAIAGSSTVFPVAEIWSAVYQVGCDVSFAVEGGGSSNGAGRVCADPDRDGPVDIGDMSREWKDTEADESLGFLYECKVGDPDRSAIQIPVAIDGITVATGAGGSAQECIALLGGLTVDQLRWIFSDYTEAQLEATGWDPSSLKNSDQDSSTHLWSELDERCQPVEVRIAGPDDESGTYEFFLEVVLADHKEGETFDVDRVHGYLDSTTDEELVSFLQHYGEAISYFGYSYYYQYKESLYAVATMNGDGDYVVPTDASIGDGTYNPLARRIYMNLLNDETSLEDTVPFVKFGLGTKSLVPVTGYVAMSDREVAELMERLDDAPYETGEPTDSDKLSTGAIAGIAAGVFVGACVLMVVAYVLYKKSRKTVDDTTEYPPL